MSKLDIQEEIINNNGWVNDKIKLYRQSEGDEISVYVFAKAGIYIFNNNKTDNYNFVEISEAKDGSYN